MNYYEQTFEKLCLEQEKEQALNEMAKIFLFKNTKFSLPKDLNKTDLFFQSSFIQNLTKSNLQDDDWQWALSQYFRFGNIDENLLKFFLDLDEENTVFSVRLSGIINNPEHSSWNSIKNQKTSYQKLNDFIEVVDCLNQQYQELQDNFLTIKKKWQWTHIDTIIFSSLYLYEIVLTQDDYYEIKIPYLGNQLVIKETVFIALNDIITQSYRDRRPLKDKTFLFFLRDKLSPFLFSENIDEKRMREYDDFKNIIAEKIKIINFQEAIIDNLSYEKNIDFYTDNGEVKLSLHNSHSSYDFYREKFMVLQLYWKWRGIQLYKNNKDFDIEQDARFQMLNKGENFYINLEAYLDTQSAIMLLKEIYGIETIIINNNKYEVFDTLFAIIMQQKFHQYYFAQEFLYKLYNTNSHPFEILGEMCLLGLRKGKNRFPFYFINKQDKIKGISSLIIEGSNRSKIRKMTDIMDFWSINLNEPNQDSYVEKPLYQLDNWIIEFPQRVSQQNIYGAIINYLRRLHKNRETLKDETSTMEKSLAELFIHYNFKVFYQYLPNDNSVGEIDLIVSDNNTVLVIELKSTYIKTSPKESYHYENFTLKKASYQLDKKLKYVKDNFQEFIDKPFNEIKFYSWIVDTTLESDHKYFNQHLKVSLEELVIYLKGHQNFINFIEHNPKILNDFDETLLFKDNKIISNLQDFIEKIESNKFWNNSLEKYKKFEDRTMT